MDEAAKYLLMHLRIAKPGEFKPKCEICGEMLPDDKPDGTLYCDKCITNVKKEEEAVDEHVDE